MKHLLFGFHSIQAALQQQPELLLSLHIARKQEHSEALNKILQLAKLHQIPINHSAPKTLDKLTDNARHQGLVAAISKFIVGDEKELMHSLKSIENPLILILEHVQDPRNFGACLRSAAAANVDCVIFVKGNASPITPLVHHTSAGTSFSLNLFQVANLARCIAGLKKQNVWCYGLEANSKQSLYQTDFSTGSAIIVGSEGVGLKQRTRSLCDANISIPMSLAVESLNVSVATAISLFEANRQRNHKKP